MGLLVDDFNRLNAAVAEGKILLHADRRHPPGGVAGKVSLPRPISFGRPLPPSAGLTKARTVVQHLSSDFVEAHYEAVRELGRGSFSRVQLVRERRTGCERVCKVVDTSEMSREVLQLSRTELQVLTILDHPSVVKLYEYSDDPAKQRLVLILEYVAGGDCGELLAQSEEPLNEARVARLIRQLLVAVSCCHARGIAHRDIKPQNMMLTRSAGAWGCPDVKMIDFGLAAIMQTSRDLVGTPAYMPPEVLSGTEDYTSQVDMWSIGCTVVELLTGEVPFGRPEDFGNDMEPVFEAIRNCKSFDDVSGPLEELPGWTSRSDEAHDFVRRLLRTEPARRMTATQALNHPWIARHSPPQTGLTVDMVRSMVDFAALPLLLRSCHFLAAARLGFSEQARLCAAFADADSDGGGSVSLEELVDAFQGASMCGWGAVDIDVSAVLAACDLGGTSRMSFTEFAAACSFGRAVGHNPERLAELSFRALDSDRDEKVWAHELHSLFPGECLDELDDLPSHRPFTLQEWCKCLRAVATASAPAPESALGCSQSGWQDTGAGCDAKPLNPLMRFLRSLMCEQLLCNGCEQYREDDDSTSGDAPVLLCHNYDPSFEVPLPEHYRVPDIPVRLATAGRDRGGGLYDVEVLRSFPMRGPRG